MNSGTRKKRIGVIGTVLGAALLWLTGCAVDTAELGEDFATVSQALRCHDGNGNPTGDANCPWKFLSRITPSVPANDITHKMSPAVCANDNSTLLTISVDTNNQYRMIQSHWIFASNWLLYGASKTFASRPACAMRENDTATGESGFVVAGKATDNKIYASAGVMAPGGSPQSNPSFTTAFQTVSNTTYPTGGGPALARGGFGGDAIVLVHMGDGDRRIYAHTRDIPYLGNSWSARISGPQLPTGWTPVGAPAITSLVVTFQIVVHAKNALGQSRLFETHFYVGSSKHFSNNIGSPASAWTQLGNLGRIDDEPALSYHDQHGSTVYFRRFNPLTNTSQIMQTGGIPLGSTPVLAVKPNENVNFTGSPAALANWAFESQNGRHTMTARTTSDQLWVGVTMPDNLVVP